MVFLASPAAAKADFVQQWRPFAPEIEATTYTGDGSSGHAAQGVAIYNVSAPLSDGALYKDHLWALNFWRARNVYPCGQTIRLADLTPTSVLAAAYTPGCDMYIDRSFYAGYWWGRQAGGPSGSWWQERMCRIVFHEYGHEGGLAHNPTPHTLMFAYEDRMAMPFECAIGW